MDDQGKEEASRPGSLQPVDEPATDWGQDFQYLRKWQNEHPEARPLRLDSTLPLVDPANLGIQYVRDVPLGPALNRRYTRAQMVDLGPQPGWYAVGVSRLHRPSFDLAYFLCFNPVAMAGYSVYIYHISPDDADRVRRQLGMPELPRAGRSAWPSSDRDMVPSDGPSNERQSQ